MKHLSIGRKQVLITGAGKRVGADIARYFAEHGFDILLHYHSSREAALELKDEIESSGNTAVTLVTGDLSKENDVAAIFSEHSPDVVINNAGRFETDDLNANIDANVRAVYLVNRMAIDRMRKDAKRGTIFVVGDAFIESGGVYSEHLDGYTMSKGWIPHLVSQLAAAYGKHGIRVLGILNGPIEPPPSASEEAIAAIQKEINLPESELDPWIGGTKVGEAMYHLFLAKAINGECIRVDGGRRWQTAKEH